MLIKKIPTAIAALRHVRSAISVTKGLTFTGNDHQYLKTKSYPASKLAERQKHFFSTKSKRKLKEKRSILSETTIEEVNNTVPLVCAFCLKEDPPISHGDIIDWVECGSCKVWVHTLCDHVEDNLTICAACVLLRTALFNRH